MLFELSIFVIFFVIFVRWIEILVKKKTRRWFMTNQKSKNKKKKEKNQQKIC